MLKTELLPNHKHKLRQQTSFNVYLSSIVVKYMFISGFELDNETPSQKLSSNHMISLRKEKIVILNLHVFKDSQKYNTLIKMQNFNDQLRLEITRNTAC